MASSSLLPDAAEIDELEEGVVVRHEGVWYQAVRVQPRPGQRKQMHWQALPSIAPVEALPTEVDFGTGVKFQEGRLQKLWSVTSTTAHTQGGGADAGGLEVRTPVSARGMAGGRASGGRGTGVRGRRTSVGGGAGAVTLLEDTPAVQQQPHVQATVANHHPNGVSRSQPTAPATNSRFTPLHAAPALSASVHASKQLQQGGHAHANGNNTHQVAAAAPTPAAATASAAAAAAAASGCFTADAIRRPDFAFSKYPVLYSIRCKGELACAASAVCIEAGDCPDNILVQRADTGAWFQPLKNSNSVSYWKLVTPPKVDSATGRPVVSGLLEATPARQAPPMYFLIQTLN
jgi:hypothetical protein